MPAASSTGRSPSPTPQAPIADSPGPRAQALQNIFNQALNSTLKKCNYKNFAACFPTPAEYVPETLDAFHRDFIGRLGEACKSNFEAIMLERNVIPSLNILDALLEDAKRRKTRAELTANGGPPTPPVAPHTLPPEPLYSAHLAPFLTSTTTGLKAELNNTQNANLELFGTIQEQRKELDAFVSSLEAVVKDLERAGGMLGEVRDEVRREIRDIELDLQR
ncbi:Nnf1-domain-containing protein [Patellaria atrata CBS 101060]|uniref:Nnf1-domain-containing protein n=1 Tax=Patellaria atrata CBS 101060 TaxID=1346257 RepID=A0A9P4S874_9PEZI|nr:Nnf1-domain-containing protein [Patellaria atrata CBS 101060]